MIKERLLLPYTTSTAHANRRGFDKLKNVIFNHWSYRINVHVHLTDYTSADLGTKEKCTHTNLQKVYAPECFRGFCFVSSSYFLRLTIILYKIFNSAFDFGTPPSFGNV